MAIGYEDRKASRIYKCSRCGVCGIGIAVRHTRTYATRNTRTTKHRLADEPFEPRRG